MSLLIVSNLNDKPLRQIPLADRRKITVGRSPQRDLILNDPKVSRLHCILYFEGDGWRIADARSSGGTWIEGRRIAWKRLRIGRIARVGDLQLWISETPVAVIAGSGRLRSGRESWTLVEGPGETMAGGVVPDEAFSDDRPAGQIRPTPAPTLPGADAAPHERSAFLAAAEDFIPLEDDPSNEDSWDLPV